jgi:acetyltransferase-like isoleucine patch superfamily enzyme
MLSVSDMHSIVSVETGERLNPGGSVMVGDHVWLGVGCRIMKAVRIGAGSVIGAGAIVTRDIPPNALAAGAPAEVTKTGITWTRELL